MKINSFFDVSVSETRFSSLMGIPFGIFGTVNLIQVFAIVSLERTFFSRVIYLTCEACPV